MIALTFRIDSYEDMGVLILKENDGNMFGSCFNPPINFVIINHKLYRYSTTGTCPNGLDLVYYMDDGKMYKKCIISKEEMRLAYSTGIKNNVDVPRYVTSTDDLLRYLKHIGEINVDELPIFQEGMLPI